MLFPTNGCWEENHISFLFVFVLGNERASQFSTNKSIVPECRWALCPIAAKRLIFRNVCLKRLTKLLKRKKGLIGLHDFYFYSACLMCFQCWMCSWCCFMKYLKTLMGISSNKSTLINYWLAISKLAPGNFTLTHHCCVLHLLDLLAAAASQSYNLFWIGLERQH